MKKFFFMLSGMVLLSPLLFVTSTLAWRCGRGMGGWQGGAEPGFCWLADIPHLTSEQSAKLTELQKKFIEDTSELRSTLAVKRIELDQLLSQPQPKPDEVNTKQKELFELQSQLRQKCISRQLEIRKIIPEEQLSSLYYRGWPGTYCPPTYMRGYGIPAGQGVGPGSGRNCGDCWGCGPRCW